jgi:hypothetical protein
MLDALGKYNLLYSVSYTKPSKIVIWLVEKYTEKMVCKPVLRIRIHWIYMFLGLLDPVPDPLVRGLGTDSDSTKPLISTVLWLLFDFLPLKNYVKVPSKSKMQKNFFKKLVFCWHLEGQWWKLKDLDPHPDPLVRGMDPRIRIHTKMSWIRKNGASGPPTLMADYKPSFKHKMYMASS